MKRNAVSNTQGVRTFSICAITAMMGGFAHTIRARGLH